MGVHDIAKGNIIYHPYGRPVDIYNSPHTGKEEYYIPE